MPLTATERMEDRQYGNHVEDRPPCYYHSGIVEHLKENDKRLAESTESLKSIHRRFDEMKVVVDNKVDTVKDRIDDIEEKVSGITGTVSSKIHEYGLHIHDEFAKAFDLYNNNETGVIMGRDGLKAQFEEVKRNVSMTFKIMKWVGIIMLAVIGAHYTPVGKVMALILGK